jgi:hypothetical protein
LWNDLGGRCSQRFFVRTIQPLIRCYNSSYQKCPNIPSLDGNKHHFSQADGDAQHVRVSRVPYYQISHMGPRVPCHPETVRHPHPRTSARWALLCTAPEGGTPVNMFQPPMVESCCERVSKKTRRPPSAVPCTAAVVSLRVDDEHPPEDVAGLASQTDAIVNEPEHGYASIVRDDVSQVADVSLARVEPDPSARRKADTWTQAFYVGSLSKPRVN